MTTVSDEHVVEIQSKISDISSRHTKGDSFLKGRAEISSTEDSNRKMHLDDAFEPVTYGVNPARYKM